MFKNFLEVVCLHLYTVIACIVSLRMKSCSKLLYILKPESLLKTESLKSCIAKL